MEKQENIVFLDEFLKETIYIIPEKKYYLLSILFHNLESVGLNEVEELLLSKILKAVKISMKDVRLINTASLKKYQIKLADIETSKLISFGVDIKYFDTAVNWEENKNLTIDGLTLIYTDNLMQLDKDNEQKKALWTSLKIMFP